MKKVVFLTSFLILIVSCGSKNNTISSTSNSSASPFSICNSAAIASNTQILATCMAGAMNSNISDIAKDAEYFCQQAENINQATCMAGVLASGDREQAKDAKFFCQSVTDINEAKCIGDRHRNSHRDDRRDNHRNDRHDQPHDQQDRGDESCLVQHFIN